MTIPESDDGMGEEIAQDAQLHLAAADYADATGPVDAMLAAVINARAWQLATVEGKRAEAAELRAHGVTFDEGLQCDTCQLSEAPGWFRARLAEETGMSREAIDDWATPPAGHDSPAPWPCWVVLTHFPEIQGARRHIKHALDMAYGEPLGVDQ